MLVRRANPPRAGTWGMPGGKIDRGETLFQAAARELAEETGLQATAVMALPLMVRAGAKKGIIVKIGDREVPFRV